MNHPLAHGLLGLLVACSGKETTGPTTDATTDTETPSEETDTTPPDPTDTPTTAHTGIAHSASPAHTGAHTGAPASTADTALVGDLASLVPGDWRPVSITQGGNPQPLPDDPSRWYVLDPSGTLTLGCGNAPRGTWTFDPKGPPPSIGIIEVDLGFPLSWYVLSLDQQRLVFVEGGDQFEYARDLCPP